MSTIAVVYLARIADGYGAIDSFAKSYRDHSAGQPHDLIIVCKGFSTAGEYAAIDAIFDRIPHQILAVEDSIGFDLHAYKAAAEQFDHEYFCFLNTYSMIQSDDWLKKLFSNLSRRGVGLVGASGSYESLYNSLKVVSCITWCVKSNIALSRDVLRNFAWILPNSQQIRSRSPKQILKKVIKKTLTGPRDYYRRMRWALADLLSGRPTLLERYDGVWSDSLSLTGPYSALRDYPRFPNPHIRTNVFMVRRDDFLAVPIDDYGETKRGCLEFESGPRSLSRYVQRKGLQLLVVGADGVGYEVKRWPTCGAFRSGNQSNLLASDNRTKDFDVMTPEVRASNMTMGWGGYLPGAAPNVRLFGVSFSNEQPLCEISHPPARNQDRQRLFSVVIPTHNGLSLLLDAIKTVLHQDYPNWEVLVFDNASDEPIDEALRALGDSRIRCVRSKEVLPVTECWNSAFDLARGEYITLISNEDGLAPGFFDRISQLADHFQDPDAVISSLYQFTHPGVSPTNRAGSVADLKVAAFFEDRDYPFLIDRATAQRAVDSSLQMRRSMMCVMPAFTVARTFLDSLRREGKVFHSPFPNCYFANLVLERAKKIVGEPKPLAFQGVSRGSRCCSMMNSRGAVDGAPLGLDQEKDPLLAQVAQYLLPGSDENSQYILTMAYLARVIDNPTRRPDFSRYRIIQIAQWIKAHGSLKQSRATAEGRAFWSRLSRREKSWARKMGVLHTLAKRIWSGFDGRLDRAARQNAYHPPQVLFNVGDYVNGFEVFKAWEQGGVARSACVDSTE